jgi:A/G-specific adenine glycosylase
MLQQTRVAAVLPRYGEFLQRFPSVERVARARQTSVLAAWSGLGYYRRARALHKCARAVCRNHAGKFPQTAEELGQLPGIGRYTAAAIASIAFGQPCPVVDGNVIRLLSRLAGAQLSPAESWNTAEALLCPRRPGDFNQAMMELGATICLPGKPQCASCPVARWCEAKLDPMPVRENQLRRKKKVRQVLAIAQRGVLLVQRGMDESLMPGMWELPAANGNARGELLRVTHSITNTDYAVTVLRWDGSASGGSWVPLSRIKRLPLTGLARKVLKRYGIIK